LSQAPSVRSFHPGGETTAGSLARFLQNLDRNAGPAAQRSGFGKHPGFQLTVWAFEPDDASRLLALGGFQHTFQIPVPLPKTSIFIEDGGLEVRLQTAIPSGCWHEVEANVIPVHQVPSWIDPIAASPGIDVHLLGEIPQQPLGIPIQAC
jgi:hypothetical protein